jgi:thiamine biosynthesis lipoprotein
MDTFVSASVISFEPAHVVVPRLDQALGWFAEVERVCSRFDPASELSRLCQHVGQPVEVSTLLLQATRFALELARMTDGAFDPTVGRRQIERGFDRNYRTDARLAPPTGRRGSASYTDVRVDVESGTVTLLQPLTLDLGAVAKGLAIDLAMRELHAFANVCVDGGGDVRVRGVNELGTPWRIGIRHPRDPEEMLRVLKLSDGAVCTSGDYERPGLVDGEHHLLDPRTGSSPAELASVTVMAPTALVADGLSTAVFVLGRDAGRQLLERYGVRGVLVSQDLEVLTVDAPRAYRLD